MNEFDIVPTGGDALVPSHAPDLVPADAWVVPSPDFITEHEGSYSGGTPAFFGAPLDGASMQQAEQAVNQMASMFSSDMAQYGFDSWMVNEAVRWFTSNALLPTAPTEPSHGYRLHGFRFPASDRDAVNSFLNHMARVNAPQRFVATCLWWVAQLGQQQQPQHQQQRHQAATIDSLTDHEYQIVKARAARDLENSTAILRQRWGDQFTQRMAVVQNHVKNLPAQQREWLNSAVTSGGCMLANSVECVERLYAEAIHKTIDPGNLAGEIQQIENTIRTDRKRYNSDPVMQERLRVLYGLRDG